MIRFNKWLILDDALKTMFCGLHHFQVRWLNNSICIDDNSLQTTLSTIFRVYISIIPSDTWQSGNNIKKNPPWHISRTRKLRKMANLSTSISREWSGPLLVQVFLGFMPVFFHSIDWLQTLTVVNTAKGRSTWSIHLDQAPSNRCDEFYITRCWSCDNWISDWNKKINNSYVSE